MERKIPMYCVTCSNSLGQVELMMSGLSSLAGKDPFCTNKNKCVENETAKSCSYYGGENVTRYSR